MTPTVSGIDESARVPVAAIDFGPVGLSVPLDSLLPAAVYDVAAVDPFDHRWSVGRDAMAGNVRAIAEQMAGLAAPPRFLVAQCASTQFALELAAGLAAAGVPLAALMLVEPILVTAEVLASHVCQLVSRLGVEPGPSLNGDATALAERPTELEAHVRALFRSAAELWAGHQDLEPGEVSLVEQIVERYVDWVCFLSAQIGAGRVDARCPVHVVGSADEELAVLLRSVHGTTAVTEWVLPAGASPELLRDRLADILAVVPGVQGERLSTHGATHPALLRAGSDRRRGPARQG
jgi:hypothetical protein